MDNLNLMSGRRLAQFREMQIKLVDVSVEADANYLMERQISFEHWLDDEIGIEVEKMIISEGYKSVIFPITDGFKFLVAADIKRLRILTGNAMELVAQSDGQGWVKKQLEIENWFAHRIETELLKRGTRLSIGKNKIR
jgi:hypothetical protein